MGLHVDELATLLAGGEYNHTVNESEERMVLAHADIETGMVHGAALTLQDVACLAIRATRYLHTKSFAF